MRRRRPALRRNLTAAALVAAAVFTPAPGAAQATPYVALSDPAYADMDLLVAAGLVQGLLTRERPYSRSAFARAVVGVRAIVDARPPDTDGPLRRVRRRRGA